MPCAAAPRAALAFASAAAAAVRSHAPLRRLAPLRPPVRALAQSVRAAPRPRHDAVLPPLLRFDKVPDKLPDWWDDEDDEDDESPKTKKKRGGGGSGGGKGSSGGGGGGGGDDDDDDDDDDEPWPTNPFLALVALYKRQLARRPLITQAVVTCAISLTGDYFAQRLAYFQQTGVLSSQTHPFAYDVARGRAVGIFTFAFLGPALHTWFGALDKLFPGARFATVRKVAVDQIFFAPFMNSCFLLGTGLLEGGAPRDVALRLREKFVPMMQANWSLWPAAQLINFSVVPASFRVVFANCVALGWNVILTYISHQGRDEERDGKRSERPVGQS